MIDPFRCWYIQGLLGPLLASFLGGQDKGDVAILAKQATNVNIIKHSLDILVPVDPLEAVCKHPPHVHEVQNVHRYSLIKGTSHSKYKKKIYIF